jgi:hypothetical protein
VKLTLRRLKQQILLVSTIPVSNRLRDAHLATVLPVNPDKMALVCRVLRSR